MTSNYVHEVVRQDFSTTYNMDVGDATSTTSMDVVKVGLEKQVGLELERIQG